MRLKIAARKSDLARLQAYIVADALKKITPDLNIEFYFKASLGDQNLDLPLWTMGSKGVFTEDFYQDLLSGNVDLVVHSWKDLPVAPRSGSTIAATLPREDLRDVFLFKKSHWNSVVQSGELKVLSSSPRRAYNLESFLPQAFPADLKRCLFTSIRGNIPTRIRRFIEGDGDSLVLAKAALDRLLLAPQDDFKELQKQLRTWLDLCWWMVLPLTANPSAAAQGALAIEAADNNRSVLELLAKVNCPTTFAAVQAERECLAGYGGGCHQKIGVSVLVRPYGRLRFLKGLTDHQEVLNSIELDSFDAHDFPRASIDCVWPAEPSEEAGWFQREPVSDYPLEQLQQRQTSLWVGRSEALPEKFAPQFDQVIWTAGLKSWQKLAQRGIWVNGSAESLGEQEPERLNGLLASPPKWVKVSHEAGVSTPDRPLAATYRLVPQKDFPNLKGKTHFFWPSASAFDRALELYPEIKSGYHACGPGHTFNLIAPKVAQHGRLKVFLSHQQWLQSIVEKTGS